MIHQGSLLGWLFAQCVLVEDKGEGVDVHSYCFSLIGADEIYSSSAGNRLVLSWQERLHLL